MKTFYLVALLLCPHCCYSQTNGIDSLRARMAEGNPEALKAMGKYLGSKKMVREFLGYHLLNTAEKHIAVRYLKEDCLFGQKLILNDTTSPEKFADFLSSNQIEFDESIGYFVLKKQEPVQTKYALFKSSSPIIDSINARYSKDLPLVMTESGADWSYSLRNPQCLLLLAQYFLKQRAKWNIYNFNDETYVECFRYLTHVDFAVPDSDSSLNFTYYLTSECKRTSLYSYFYYHYKDYQWNDSLHYFVNTRELPAGRSELYELFESLKSPNDSIALLSFSRLCKSDPAGVARIAKEVSIDRSGLNENLPRFSYTFLPAIANLISYYGRNKIAYEPLGELEMDLKALATDTSFKRRYELEELLISKATVDDIYAIEYFGVLNADNFDCTYSIGRILDKWYSKNWNVVCSNKQHLAAYLKKSEQFDNLGIIGNCNKYLRKFRYASPSVLDSVKAILTPGTDSDIVKSATLIMAQLRSPGKEVLPPIKRWDGEKEYHIANPAFKMQLVIQSTVKKDEKRSKIEKMSGMITYGQIGSVVKQLLKDTVLENYSKFSFLGSDFGLYLENLENKTIDSFLNKYHHLSQKDLYLTNLLALGINVESQGVYNYRQMYEILKYDVAGAFAGGGGGLRDHNVYQVIKLLELKFGTTLGFVNKLCSWQGIWGCDCSKRARYWMTYLKEKKLVTADITGTESISSGD